jgi:chromosome segregation ATPase
MNIVDPRLQIGGNKPPIAEQMKENHRDLFEQLEQLAAAAELVPPVILNDEDEGAAQDVVLKCKRVIKTADAMHKLEKEPYDKIIKELKAAFAIPTEKVEKVVKVIVERLDVYKEKKAAEERRKREEEARKQREEAERLQREAEEADRKRREAEEARRIEEERAARAQAERERAEREAREARERAERLREEQARLERERKEREAREAEEAKAKAVQDEKDRIEREARRKAEEEAHAKRMAELKAQREEEDRKAREAREAAAKALEERRQAEEAAAAAKRDERANAKIVNNAIDDAVRMEKRADKLDGAAQASEADLSRGRGDYGSVGSRVTTWTYTIINRDRIPLEKLRSFIHPDAIDAAVSRFMQANRPELGKGRDCDDLLPGVEFHTVTNTRVA